MCGIAGMVTTQGARVADVEPMIAAQQHRGPDAGGTWSDDVCALGHRRLSVIDLSEAADQPLADDAGRLLVVFNGEIYNYKELRTELTRLGHRFRTQGDSEVIVYAYAQWGTACVTRLRGMFALAIWDRRARRLMLARDRVGKKPLFYAHIGSSFIFASELQGLRAHALAPRQIDTAAIDAYLSWGYIPAPASAFRGVCKLPPAHWLTVDVTEAGLTTNIERYWSLDYETTRDLSFEDAATALRDTLTTAVRLRMASDVPLGAFLSGGIDSSIVVAIMAQLSPRPVQTFSIGFDEAAFDELPHARRVAQRWRTDHHELVVRPDALAVLPTLVRHFGEPYADSSAIPTFYLSQLARTHVTVAQSGDGGDESFAGYDRYRALRASARIAGVPGGRTLARIGSALLPDSIDPRSPVRRIKRFLGAVPRPAWERYARWMQYFNDDHKAVLYSPDMHARCDGRASRSWMESLAAAPSGVSMDPVNAAMRVDVQSYLPFDLLVKVDITSMANSLEVRSPFLDHEVMEYAAALPSTFKLHGARTKAVLKAAFADVLDPAITRRPKMGFGVPVGQWFRGPLREWLRETLLSNRSLSRGYFNEIELRRLVDDHQSSRSDYGAQLWSLLMLELWHLDIE